MVVKKRTSRLPTDDDLLTPAQAWDELGVMVFDFTPTKADRLRIIAKRGGIKPGVRGENGRVQYRRGDLLDAAFEFYFHGRKRRTSA